MKHIFFLRWKFSIALKFDYLTLVAGPFDLFITIYTGGGGVKIFLAALGDRMSVTKAQAVHVT